MMTLVDAINREKPPENGGGIIITGIGTGEGPRSGLIVGAAGPAAEGSTRAAAVAGTMLGVLVGVVSLVWALYTFRPGVVAKSSDDGGTGAPAGVELTPGGTQMTPLLPSTAAHTESVVAITAPPAGDVDLANYFSPMTTSTSTTMSRGCQADLDSDAAAGWTVSSALVTQSSVDEVTKSCAGGLTSGTGTKNVAIQTANLRAETAGQGAATGTSRTVYSTSHSYESRTASDTAHDTSQVCNGL